MLKMKKNIKLLAGISLGLMMLTQPMDVLAGGSYRVQSGDTLSKIANKNNISLNELVRINNIKNRNVIHPGQLLKLSGQTNTSGNSSVNSKFANEAKFPIERKYYRVSSPYGQRVHPITGNRTSFHNGIDLAASGINRTNVYSVLEGTVRHSGNTNNGYGNYVVIDHDGFSTLYAHMDRTYVNKGQKVSAGSRIGLVGTTGQSTGPHLHFEININGSRVDPKPYLDAIGNSVSTSSSSSQANNQNQTNTKSHRVVSGDTVGKIARKYNTTRQNIVRLNNLKNPNLIIVGQNLIVSEEKVTVKPNTNTNTNTNSTSSTYRVKSGDSLWKIGRAHNISVRELKRINNLRSDMIFVGQSLNVKGNSQSENTSNNTQSTTTYRVKRGDSLWKIANSNGLSVRKLKEMNQLRSDLIFVGQTLVI